MGKTRKGLQAAGIGFAAAGILFFGQAGAAHAPMVYPAPTMIAATAAATTAPALEKPANRTSSARPLKNLRVKIPASRLSLSPAVERTSYARLALGPISYPDGALKLPGRIEPVAPEPEEGKKLHVGHSVSLPTAVRRPNPFDFREGYPSRPSNDETSPILAGMPLVSPAQAADANSASEGIGGPLSRLPIQGHILFRNSEDILTVPAQAQLDRLVTTLRTDHAAIDVVAYGGEQGSKSSKALRLALGRGRAVRAYLISRGIGQGRITVHPMGGVRDGGPQARVDVFYASID